MYSSWWYFFRKRFQSKCERHVQTNGYCATKEANTKILQRRIPILESLINLSFIELKKQYFANIFTMCSVTSAMPYGLPLVFPVAPPAISLSVSL